MRKMKGKQNRQTIKDQPCGKKRAHKERVHAMKLLTDKRIKQPPPLSLFLSLSFSL